MKIHIFVEKENKNIIVNVQKERTIEDLLQTLKINKNSVIIIKNNELVPEDFLVKDNDNLQILSVISGG